MLYPPTTVIPYTVGIVLHHGAGTDRTAVYLRLLVGVQTCTGRLLLISTAVYRLVMASKQD